MPISDNARLFNRFLRAVSEAKTFDEFMDVQRQVDLHRSSLDPITALYLDEEIELEASLPIYTAMFETNVMVLSPDNSPDPQNATPMESFISMTYPGGNLRLSADMSVDEMRKEIDNTVSRDINELITYPEKAPENIRVVSLLEIPGFIAAAHKYEQDVADASTLATKLCGDSSSSNTPIAAEDMSHDALVAQVRDIALSATDTEELMEAMEYMTVLQQQAQPFMSEDTTAMPEFVLETLELHKMLDYRARILAAIEGNRFVIKQRRRSRAAGISELDAHTIKTDEHARAIAPQLEATAQALKEQAPEIRDLLASDDVDPSAVLRLTRNLQKSVYRIMKESEELNDVMAAMTPPTSRIP